MVMAGVCQGQQPFRISLSVSPFTELLFKRGIVFTDGQVTARNAEELQRLYVRYGANEVYARIATTRSYRTGFGDHSLNKGLERARLAKALNLPFNPELGLFNIYGDIRCQPSPDFSEYPELKVPGDWPALSLEQMLPALRSYGAIAAREILKTGVKVRIWDVGNEVEFGTAGIAVRPMPDRPTAAPLPDAHVRTLLLSPARYFQVVQGHSTADLSGRNILAADVPKA